LAGTTSLRDHLALVSLAAVVLTMDSSTAHIAGALERPAVVILGGGHPGFFGPWGNPERFRWLRNPLPCYGCNWTCVMERPLCIEDIPPAEIARHVLAVAGGNRMFPQPHG
jgi:heptosyltransferase II